MKEWSNPERIAEYLAREIPHRRTAEAMLLQALPERVDRFLDLGTGDGRLVSLLRSAHPDAEAIGLDSSEPMLARARRRCDGDAGIEFRLADLCDQLDWLRAGRLRRRRLPLQMAAADARGRDRLVADRTD